MNQNALIKQELETYLCQKGINTAKPFRCLNPAHADEHPSMRFDRKRNKAHCFACGADYDTFDVFALDNSLPLNKECFDQAQKFFLKGLNEYTHNTDHTDYAHKRGLSDEIIKRFNLQQQDYKFSDGTIWNALVIPTSGASMTLRNTDTTTAKHNRIRKIGKVCLFNSAALHSGQPIFVVEGELDALSVCEVGAQAVGLGSTSNCRQLLAHLNETGSRPCLLLALDNDAEGQRTAEKLLKELESLGVSCRVVQIAEGCKDANEALLKNRKMFEQAVKTALESCVPAEENDSDDLAWLFQPSAPAIQSGSPRLDAALGGGFYEGLYILGAITSLGKTTFLLQIADHIAQSRDVLFFSLEMSKKELITKSVSRHTLQHCLQNKLPVSHAKSVREVAANPGDGIVVSAVNCYKSYAKNMYIQDELISAAGVHTEIEKHIKATGNTPVVMIDYIQILQNGGKMSDKQNMDASIMELKRISRVFSTPVICVSSFNRQSYKEAVTMEAFKESGAIEYSSDVLLGLQFSGAGEKGFDLESAKMRDPRRVEVRVLKNRNGEAGGVVSYEYYARVNYFRES